MVFKTKCVKFYANYNFNLKYILQVSEFCLILRP